MPTKSLDLNTIKLNNARTIKWIYNMIGVFFKRVKKKNFTTLFLFFLLNRKRKITFVHVTCDYPYTFT